MTDAAANKPDEKKLSPEEQRALVTEITANYEAGASAFEENRRLFTEDMLFAYGSEEFGQWDPLVLAQRKGRPNYTFNRVIGAINLVIADQRQSRPAAKVRPSSEDATGEVAEIFGGLHRSAEQASRAEVAYDEQFKNAVAGGFGYWYWLPEYGSDKSFDQVLRLHNVTNPLTVILDPECNDPCGGDARWGMIGDRISKDDYKALYPDGDMASFTMSRDSRGWWTDKEVRVVSYFRKTRYKKTIARLSDERVIDYDAEAQKVDKHLDANGLNTDKAARIVDTREVDGYKILWCKCDGANILEGPIEYEWKRVPIVRCPGRFVNIEGRKKFQSFIRHSKDSQRAYNFHRSDEIERSALVAKAPYMVTAKQIKGLEDIWATANTAPRPYLPYNHDPDAPGKPTRESPIDVPAGSAALAQQDAADIQATTGMFDPALGNAEDMNRVSGKALVQHVRRSDLGSYEFIDGFGKALQLSAEMFIDMAPTVMDGERVERIIGLDGAEKLVQLNTQKPGGSPDDLINDLKAGSYDVTVTLGPSYQTARQETLATLIDAAQTIPQIGQVAPDLIAKNIDSPDADEIARRLRGPLIKAGVVQPTPQEKAQLAQQPGSQPNPMQEAELTLTHAKALKALADAHIASSKAASGDLYIHEHVLKAASDHLDNIIKAQQIGLTARQATQVADAAETQAAAPLSPAVPAAPGAPMLPGQ